MQDSRDMFDSNLSGLNKAEWRDSVADLVGDAGYLQPLGRQHAAIFVEGKSTLLVTFETFQGIQSLSESAHPLGWDMVQAMGWSHLALVSDGDTWFRDDQVFAYFDQLSDEGFFDEFDRVVFYGAGPCGYAAAAFSVAAPGATVVAIQPQATLDPDMTEWDDRFTHMRRVDFRDRYGYAPDMLDAAERCFLIYDPVVDLDAMHAALYTRTNVEKLRTRNLGATVQSELLDMQLLHRVLARAASGKLDRVTWAKLYRMRREHPPYLRGVLRALRARDRTGLAIVLCRNVISRMPAPRFERRLKALEAEMQEAEDAGQDGPGDEARREEAQRDEARRDEA